MEYKFSHWYGTLTFYHSWYFLSILVVITVSMGHWLFCNGKIVQQNECPKETED